MLNTVLKWSLFGVAWVSLAACEPQAESPNSTSPASQSANSEAFALTIAHINDHHSNLAPLKRTQIELDGEELTLESGGFARVVAQIKQLQQQHDYVLKLHAGDAITGSLYYTLFQGEADAALMNEICFDAFALGNHEFDQGDAGLKTFLDFLSADSSGSACNTAVLAANVQPEVGVSPLTPDSAWDSFTPFSVYQFGGERVGVIGLDIAGKTKQSSQPDATTMFADEVTTAKRYIAKLQAQGVDKIVLLTHYQYQNDLRLAEALPAVDVIIGGDSHTLLGDFDEYGLTADGPYPTEVMNADGEKVCVAHAYQYSQVVGELQVQFNGDAIESCGGRPHFLLSTDSPAALDDSGVFTRIDGDAGAAELLESYSGQVDELTQQSITEIAEPLCMKRMGVATSEACGKGRQSDAHRVVAEAFLLAAPIADFALQNGGGVRSDIAVGAFSMGDAYRLLPFTNTLVTAEITGAELKTLLEQALTYAQSEEGSDGAYPHGAGIRFQVDMSQADGERISELTIEDSDGNWQPAEAETTYTMITNSFLGEGNDGWVLLGELNEAGKVQETYIEYAEAFVNWLQQQDVVERPREHSTQDFRAANPDAGSTPE